MVMEAIGHQRNRRSGSDKPYSKMLNGVDFKQNSRLSLGNIHKITSIEQQKSNGTVNKPRTTYRKMVNFLKKVYEKTRLQKMVPLIMLIGYTFLGGVIIYYVEGPTEAKLIEAKQQLLDTKKNQLVNELWNAKQLNLTKRDALMRLRESVYWYTITVLYMDGNLTKAPPASSVINKTVENLKKYTEQMAQRCWEITLERAKDVGNVKRLMEHSLTAFERETGVTSVIKPVWTFSNSLFLAITIYTTIGYGSVFPHTTAGRVATILYAICGIPLYLIILHKLGRVFLALLHKFYNFCLWIGYQFRCIRMTKLQEYHQTSRINFQSGNSNESYNVPVSLAIGVTFGWMFACAGVFCVFYETSWDYFTSFYFFFISLTTIGFGDVTPTNSEDMFTFFCLIIIGLCLVSMCINVVQLKLELLFEDMMIALIEETGELTPPMDFKSPLGFVRMFNFLNQKRRTQNAASRVYLPLLADKKKRLLLEEWKRKANLRCVETQTDVDASLESSTQTDCCSSNSSTKSQTPSGKSILSGDSTLTSMIIPPSTQSRSSYTGRLYKQRASVDETSSERNDLYNRRWSEAATLSRRPLVPLKYKIHQGIQGRRAQSVNAYANFMQTPRRTSRTFITYPQIHDGVKLIRVSAGFQHHSWTFNSSQTKSKVPVMYLHKMSKQVSRDDFKSLIHEIGARLTDCRVIVKDPNCNLKPLKLAKWNDSNADL